MSTVVRQDEISAEVIIIGGGPAGLFAGIVCARNGLRTLVLEKQSYPIDKACGEGIMPSGVKHLRKLGIAPVIENRAHSFFAGIRYISATRRSATAKFAEGPGWGIQRTVLSSALLEYAKTLANLEIQEGVKAGYTLGENPEVRLGNSVLRPKLIIGADGLHSRMRKLTGLKKAPSKLKRWGVRQHFHIAPWSEFVEIYWGSGLEAYVTPVSENSVNVNFLWDSKRYNPRQAGKKLFGALLQEFPDLQARLMKAETLDGSMTAGPLHQQTFGMTKNNTVLIGDAAGFFDPITGEGISLAAKQALFLEQFIVPALKQNSQSSEPYLEKSFAEYSQACAGIYRPYQAMTRLVLLLRLWPLLTGRVIQVLHTFPALFQKLLSVNMR